ncbi:MAG: radical SAM family heme chaperone HemW [Clostridia bacterium]|nr:radical SAM family heme chaperone HemW [Clostridia bacterium]
MLGIYVHVPFCVKKCGYCDFLSFPGMENCFEAYAEAVCAEIRGKGTLNKEGAVKETVDTFFVGGGTPSVLPASCLEKILRTARDVFDILPDAEITVEANPESASFEKLSRLREAGFNRLSIGFQSLSDERLKALGRVHNAEKAREAFAAARRAGFDNVNVDLIFGFPGEPEGEFERTLEEVIALKPEHVSCYSLIVEEGTPLAEGVRSGALPEPDDARDRADYRLAVRRLKEAGYVHYEISNFALPGRESRHNLRYWQQREYLGFGPGAASFKGARRFANSSDVKRYVSGVFETDPDSDEILTQAALREEFMMLGFRLTDGPDFAEFERRFGKRPEDFFAARLERLEKKGLIEKRASMEGPYALTEKGLDFANEVFAEFV